MSTDLHIGPVIAVTDLARARAFYEDQLGLEGRETPGGWVLDGAGGSVGYLLAGDPNAGSASWPVASLRSSDVHATVRRLRDSGVDFLGPNELPFALDDDGVSVDQSGMQVAWLRDPDGNVLTVFSLDKAEKN